MLKVGDMVTIRHDLSSAEVFNMVSVNRIMLQYRGQTYRIKWIGSHLGEPLYHLDLGLSSLEWSWREGMFEGSLMEPNELLALLEEV